ncbi:MAG: 30S ribosome-binding factor RbfA [Bacteroides sp.]|nr:30S ribosome-binding factor RbfA [Eubacterium sp.]MCM1419480.1 30S ribosome-binding factor RbfA [Roseburia sp.]MCM1463304.1 30S ribosome-binding factor RbfA [Bacteroides sp.]
MAKHNTERLAEDVKREISSAVREIKNPRVSGLIISIPRVELTNDLSYCKIYVSALGKKGATNKAVNALKNASGFFKKRLNARLKMYKLPELIFLPDTSLDYYDKISRMIDNLPKPAEPIAPAEAETDEADETDD